MSTEPAQKISVISENKDFYIPPLNKKEGIFRKLFRHRVLFLLGGTLITFALSFETDPDSQGLSTLLGGLAILQGIWAVAAAHLTRKALTDYKEADQRKLFAKAAEDPIGAGLALIALALIFIGLLSVFAPRAHAQDLPPGFIKYAPMLKEEQRKYWPNHPDPSVLAGLIEQESCISLKSSGCWNAATNFKTAREEGAGLGQITRAYSKNGTLRFDSLLELRNQYRNELGDLSWSNVYSRPDLQLRAVVLMSKRTASFFRETPAALMFGDAAYNGGVAGVQQERRACRMIEGCDPSLWFGHVESHCLKSRQILYGNRSACDINREHVRNVFLIRKKKYQRIMNDEFYD